MRAMMMPVFFIRPRAAEVMVDGAEIHLVRERETVQQLFAGEKIIA